MMACASDTVDPATLTPTAAEARLLSRGISGLQYYNGAMHQAAMALPKYVRFAITSTGERI